MVATSLSPSFQMLAFSVSPGNTTPANRAPQECTLLTSPSRIVSTSALHACHRCTARAGSDAESQLPQRIRDQVPHRAKPVEPLYCRPQHVDGQACLGRQLLERVGRNDDRGLQPLVRNALSRLQSRKNVAVAVALVEHQPRRDVLAGARTLPARTAIHVMTRLDIRHRLFHEPLTRHVHDDRGGRVALRQRERRSPHQRQKYDCITRHGAA